mgnify:CR=1 FL=1
MPTKFIILLLIKTLQKWQQWLLSGQATPLTLTLLEIMHNFAFNSEVLKLLADNTEMILLIHSNKDTQMLSFNKVRALHATSTRLDLNMESSLSGQHIHTICESTPFASKN